MLLQAEYGGQVGNLPHCGGVGYGRDRSGTCPTQRLIACATFWLMAQASVCVFHYRLAFYSVIFYGGHPYYPAHFE